MEQYIPKSALVAEINRLYKQHSSRFECDEAALCLEELEDFIDTLEVKEVDFEMEMQAFAKINLEPLVISDSNIGISITMSQLYNCARHFFELGMAVSNKAQKGE